MRQEGLRSEQRGDETAEGFQWAETTAGQRRVVKCGQEGCRAECPLFISPQPPILAKLLSQTRASLLLHGAITQRLRGCFSSPPFIYSFRIFGVGGGRRGEPVEISAITQTDEIPEPRSGVARTFGQQCPLLGRWRDAAPALRELSSEGRDQKSFPPSPPVLFSP